MTENLDSRKYINQIDGLNQKALEETIDLLKSNANGHYIAVPDWDDEVDTRTHSDVPISIWAVGLNDDWHLCIKAEVMDVGYGDSEDDFPEGWVDTADEHNGVEQSCYPELYRFVVENIDKATTKEEADLIKWDGDDDE